MLGIWPIAIVREPGPLLLLTLAACVDVGVAAAAASSFSPFGYAHARRAAIPTAARRGDRHRPASLVHWRAFMIAGTSLRVWPARCSPSLKGTIFPDTMGVGLHRRPRDGAARRHRDLVRPDRRARCSTRPCRSGSCSQTDYSKLVLGLVIIALVLVFPAGVAGSFRWPAARRAARARRRHERASRSSRALRKPTAASRPWRTFRSASSAGEFVALIGPNGAGKSTCFNMLNGQIRPDVGTIALSTAATSRAGRRARSGACGVGRTFQITATFASMTVIENVQIVLLVARAPSWPAVGPRDARQRARRAEASSPSSACRTRRTGHARELAYGDLKRLELAMALANAPKLLLMDEPTAGMSPRDRIELMALTGKIAREKNLGVLFTEHDMDVVFRHADRILVLSRGRLIAEGAPEEVRRNPEVQAVYLGEGLTYHGGEPSMTDMLTIRDLNARYGAAQILDDVAFSVRRGAVIALLGRNGAGKSTTFKAIVGLVERKGSVRFLDREIGARAALSNRAPRRSAMCRKTGASSPS